MWDIGGQSIAGEMIDKYVYGAHAVFVVYDVTNTASFDNVSDWVNVVRRITKQQEKVGHHFSFENFHGSSFSHHFLSLSATKPTWNTEE